MRRLTAALTFSVIAAYSFGISVAAQGNPAANIDDCANGPVSAPSGCALASSWGNGNLNASKAHYLEGDSVPFRFLFTNLSTNGNHQITIAWDTTKDGLHAFDYLTSFNRSETTTNPCVGVAGCSLAGSKDTETIPADPNITAQLGPGHQLAGVFTLFNGNITNVSTYTLDGSYSGTSTTRVTITFTATVSNPVLAFGAHVASRQDWGAGSSAATINGSPYHVSVDNLDGSGGSQDHQIATDAIYLPASITIIKDAIPSDPRDFSFATTGGLTPPTFALDDDSDPGLSNTQAYTGLLNFTTYTVTESPVSGWAVSFGTPPCTVTSPNGGTQSASASTVTINLKEGEDVTCTFRNTRQQARLTVIKHVINDNGGTATAADFTLDSGGLEDSPDDFPGSESGTTVILDPGGYHVSESGPSGYSASFSADCIGTIAAGQTKTCTVTNDDQPARLTVIKHVINDNGGTRVASDFTIDVTGNNPSPASFPGSESGTAVTLNAGSYTVTESAAPGYDTTYSADCTGTIALGQTKTCTVTTNDKAAHLVIIKNVVNDNGGTKAAGAFSGTITGVTAAGGNAWTGTAAPGVDKTLTSVGSYTVTETADPGYDTTYSADCTGTIALGQTKTCTVTNNDKAAHLVIIKNVVNDNGGTKAAGAFSGTITGVTAAGGNTWTGTAAPGVDKTLISVGSYTVTETADPGYDTTYSADCTGTIALGQTKTCTVTNNDKPAHLILIKRVINDNGGTAAPTAWILYANGPTPISGPGGVSADVKAGTYALSESGGPAGYAAGNWSCGGGSQSGSSVTLTVGQSVTCTINNDDIPAQLTVNKVCNPTSDTGRFNLQIDSITRKADAACGGTTGVVYVNAGTHTVGETAGTGSTLSDYTTAIGGACTSGGVITLSLGQSATCTITNTRKATVKVIKTVRNGTGQSVPPSGSQAFTFQLRQGSSSSAAGTILETQILNAANQGKVTFSTKLAPGTTYAFCEVVMSGWLTTLAPPFYTAGNSSAVCYDFTPAVGQILTFSISNIPSSAHLTRTIGFWKNWSSVAGHGQGPKLDQTLAASEPGGIAIGKLVLHGSTATPNVAPDAAKAVNILNKSTIDGKKMASDPAFNMAAQLLGAKLNVQTGAGVCPAAVRAINDGQSLLAAIAFNGLTHNAMSATQVNQAHSLATALDQYNNDNTLLCAAQ